MLTIEEARKFVKLDLDKLEEQCLVFPENYERVSEAYNDSLEEKDSLKDGLALLEAALSSEFRKSVAPKPTDKAVAQKVILDKEYISLQKELRDTEDTVRRWHSLEKSMTHISAMLKRLGELWVNRYYNSESKSVPSVEKRVSY